jgi:N-methylhydantoinase B
MAYAMRDIVVRFDWQDGDQIIMNDPFMGGTHLPDVTMIAPVFSADKLVGFVANRAHYADIGAVSPGSMPLSRSLDEEGVLIPAQRICALDELDQSAVDAIANQTRNAVDTRGDLYAQYACNRRGKERLLTLIESIGIAQYPIALDALNDYAERLARTVLARLKRGVYNDFDMMESDGTEGSVAQRAEIPVHLKLTITADQLIADFSGTSDQVAGNINSPVSVTAAAVWYAFRCLMPDRTPACAGCFRPVSFIAPEGSLLNAQRPSAVAAGNVDTSSRVVDVLLGALHQALPDEIPAASQGTMNNLAFGRHRDENDPGWGYYETLGGGMGAGAKHPGLSAIQSHMTNTRNTPVEVLEMHYPIRVTRYEVRQHSGGRGIHAGGNGLIREYEFMQAAKVTFLTERRALAPRGANGGEAGKPGLNLLNGQQVAAKCELNLVAGDRITVCTPGGGGWGRCE